MRAIIASAIGPLSSPVLATVEPVPTLLVIVGPDRDFRYDLDAACDQIVLRLPRRQVESVASTLTGGTGPVAFDLEVASSVGGVFAMIEAAIDLKVSGVAEARPHLLWQVEQVIVESLILGQPNSRSAQLQAGRNAAAARRVRTPVFCALADDVRDEGASEPAPRRPLPTVLV